MVRAMKNETKALSTRVNDVTGNVWVVAPKTIGVGSGVEAGIGTGVGVNPPQFP